MENTTHIPMLTSRQRAQRERQERVRRVQLMFGMQRPQKSGLSRSQAQQLRQERERRVQLMFDMQRPQKSGLSRSEAQQLRQARAHGFRPKPWLSKRQQEWAEWRKKDLAEVLGRALLPEEEKAVEKAAGVKGETGVIMEGWG